jgi:hypothetical protein
MPFMIGSIAHISNSRRHRVLPQAHRKTPCLCNWADILVTIYHEVYHAPETYAPDAG